MAHITVIGSITAKRETGEELQKLLAAQVAPTRAVPGCINYDLHVDAEDPWVFVFYENWRGQADLDAHMTMPHLAPLVSQIDWLLARPVDICHRAMLAPLTSSK